MSKLRTISIAGESFLDAIVGQDPDDQPEIQNIHSLSLQFLQAGRSISVQLEGFKNSIGQSVADVILEQHDDLLAILVDQEEQNVRQMEEDAAEDEYWRRKRG